MKKSLILFFLALSISGMRANIAAPQAYISEILVDSNGNWTMEMGFFDVVTDIDSIRMVTSAGSSVINDYSVIETGEDEFFIYLAVITNANLTNPLTINPDGDYVKLISYAWNDQPFDYVAFGTYPGAFLICPGEGESIITLIYSDGPAYIWTFCMDTSPTIGFSNDTTGAMGNYSGIAFDPAGIPFSEGWIFIQEVHNLNLEINPDGSFSERLPARSYSFDTIQVLASEKIWKYYTVEPFEFCLSPGSWYYHDIITTSLITGIDDVNMEDENIVTIAPNPFSDKVVFYFKLSNSDPGEMDFSIFSLDGRRIHGIALSPDQKSYEWCPQNSISSGTYIYRLEKDNTIVKTGKFVRY